MHSGDKNRACRGSRSSLHYDPYHNLLCLVQGEKTVQLMSPELTHLLYPMSILGESPNHSHVNFAHPDLKQHPLYKQALASQQVFTLQVISLAWYASQSPEGLYTYCSFKAAAATDHHTLTLCISCIQQQNSSADVLLKTLCAPSAGAASMCTYSLYICCPAGRGCIVHP